MLKCGDFIRDSNAPWIEFLDSQCDVCVYKDNVVGCKIDASDNRTALVHSYHTGDSGNRVRGVLK